MGYPATLLISHQLSDTITLEHRGLHIEKGNALQASQDEMEHI